MVLSRDSALMRSLRTGPGAAVGTPVWARRWKTRNRPTQRQDDDHDRPDGPVAEHRGEAVGRAADGPAAGIVSTQATTMLPATPQRTAESRLAAPAPMTPPEITCVVESGKPACEAARIDGGARALRREALGGSILMILLPIVRMIRQPPE